MLFGTNPSEVVDRSRLSPLSFLISCLQYRKVYDRSIGCLNFEAIDLRYLDRAFKNEKLFVKPCRYSRVELSLLGYIILHCESKNNYVISNVDEVFVINHNIVTINSQTLVHKISITFSTA